jgi:hypothetical protein
MGEMAQCERNKLFFFAGKAFSLLSNIKTAPSIAISQVPENYDTSKPNPHNYC